MEKSSGEKLDGKVEDRSENIVANVNIVKLTLVIYDNLLIKQGTIVIKFNDEWDNNNYIEMLMKFLSTGNVTDLQWQI